MSAVEWSVTALAVLLGSGLQAATGMGLALLVAPVLMWVTGSSVAITVAVVLNLAVSVVLLPRELGQLQWRSLRPLLWACLLGVPVGLWVFESADLNTLKLLAGLSVSAAGVQLLLRGRRAVAPAVVHGGAQFRGVCFGGGFTAGIMTACLGMPGPALTWAMGHLRVEPAAIRANLRLLFVVTYALTLVSHLRADVDARLLPLTGALLPALVLGAVLGHYAKGRIGDDALRITLEVLLFVMGISLLLDALLGCWP